MPTGTTDRQLAQLPPTFRLSRASPAEHAAFQLGGALRRYTGSVRPVGSSNCPAAEGVAVSYMRELLRRAVLRRIDADPTAPVSLEGTVLDDALAELTYERSVLTRALLGGGPAGGPAS